MTDHDIAERARRVRDKIREEGRKMPSADHNASNWNTLLADPKPATGQTDNTGGQPAKTPDLGQGQRGQPDPHAGLLDDESERIVRQHQATLGISRERAVQLVLGARQVNERINK